MTKKIFFGINITANRKNTRLDGEDFITDRVSQAQERALDTQTDELRRIQKKTRLPLPLHLLDLVSGFVTLVIFVSILKASDEVSIRQLAETMPGLLVTLGISAAVWGALALMGHFRKRRIESSDTTEATLRAADVAIAQAYETLGVPAGAIDMDVLVGRYRIKDGQPVIKPGQAATFANPEMKVFVENGELCFAAVSARYSIPLEQIVAIREIPKRISMTSWNKNSLPREGRYAPYRIQMNEHGQVFTRSYGVLDINRDGLAIYELYFPIYELPVLEQLTGIVAQKQEK